MVPRIAILNASGVVRRSTIGELATAGVVSKLGADTPEAAARIEARQ